MVTYLDADAIVKFRDEDKLDWVTISDKMGYALSTCQEHYKLRKGGKFYLCEFIARLEKHPEHIEKTTKKEAWLQARSGGYPGALRTFSNHPLVVALPFFRSPTQKEKRVKKIIHLVLGGLRPSLRDAVQSVFYDYTYSSRIAIEYEISELLRERK